MNLNPEVVRQIEEIRQDRIHGARWLSMQAIGVLTLTTENSQAKKVADFQKELRVVARELIEARPSMAPITNCVSRFIFEVYQESNLGKGLASLKSFTCSKASQLAKDYEKAFQKTTEKGAEKIANGDKLMTCSYSSTVCEAFRTAMLQGKEFHVIVTESRFGDKIYGKLTSAQLKKYKISSDTIPDNAVRHYLSKVNKVLVGADSVSADGSLINGTPTRAVALAAKESRVPFYSLCETTKFDIRSYFGKPIELEEGFDRVPTDLISGIITEEGIIKPTEVTILIEKMGWIQAITSTQLP